MKQESFGRKLFSLVLPMALQNLFSALVSDSDALMLGFLDQPSLSAVSLAGQVSFVMSLFHMAFIIGATVLAAFVLKWPIPVVYFLLNLDEFLKLPAVWRHYHRYGWVKNLTNETQEATSNG